MMKMYIVDSFTEQKFKGNPAAVCICDEELSNADCQNIAMEMNLSETAFLNKKSPSEYDLRWFTPKEEVDLCGHATLAGAHILWEKGFENTKSVLSFHTLSGPLEAVYEDSWITLDFPRQDLIESDGDRFLFEAIPGEIERVMEDRQSYVVIMKNESDILKMQPDFDKLCRTKRKEIIVTALSKNHNCDFISRFFGPAIGIKEDPVTGSAHCYLAPYWGSILKKNKLTGYQASERGGTVQCTVSGDRVKLKGRARTVLSGNMEDSKNLKEHVRKD